MIADPRRREVADIAPAVTHIDPAQLEPLKQRHVVLGRNLELLRNQAAHLPPWQQTGKEGASFAIVERLRLQGQRGGQGNGAWLRQPTEKKEKIQSSIDQRQGAGEAKGRDRLRATVPAIDALYERWVDAGRNLGSMTARTLKLLDLYGAELLGAAVEEVLARGMHDPGALAALCEQRRCARARPLPLDVPLPAHVRDRDVVPHDLETYDAKP